MRVSLAAGGFTCALTAREVCASDTATAPDKHAIIDTSAEQVCTIVQVNNAVIVKSQVTSVFDHLAEEAQDVAESGYGPDNFTLRIADADTLKGMLQSFAVAPATFVRQERPIS